MNKILESSINDAVDFLTSIEVTLTKSIPITAKVPNVGLV
jgi:hypothetical protein